MIDNNMALNVSNLTKEYKLYNSEMDRLKEAFNPFRKSYHRLFKALDGINIQIKKGEKVGIIGVNGAGKSTLLKIITGVINQTEGEIETNGKIAALLELGAGFNSNYTGIENIKLNGTLSGLTEKEVNENIDKIIDFADIGEFIDQPVKVYSSGMFVRLAFATQIFSNPDILIVDEALSVGDIRFQQKCYRAMDNLMKDKTVILVTHDTSAVTRFCDRVIWLEKGRVRYDGEVDEGLKQYKGYLIDQAITEKQAVGAGDFESVENKSLALEETKDLARLKIPELSSEIKLKGNGEAKILACGLFDQNNSLTDVVQPLQDIRLVMNVEFYKEIQRPIVGISIRDRLGNDVVALNTETVDIELPKGIGKQKFVVNFVMPELNHGQYTITVAVAEGYQDDHVQLSWADDAILFNVPRREYDVPGTIYMQHAEITAYKI